MLHDLFTRSERLSRRRSVTKALRRTPLVLAVLAAVSIGPAQNQAATASSCLPSCDVKPVALRFDPSLAPAASTESSAAQPGESWEGTAAVPDPLAVTGAADIHQFQALPGYENDVLTVTISWDPGPELSYDLDLFVDRLDEFGNWVPVGSSTGGQLLGDGVAEEVADIRGPAPGTYRARVVNWASTTITYQGSVVYTDEKGGGGKSARPRATVDRPDVAQGSQLHVIYMVPADGADEALDTNGVLENAVASMNLWVEEQTGGRHLRLDTSLDRRTGRPALDVSFVRGNRTAAEYAADPAGAFTAVTNELAERGWTASPLVKRYLVYYAGAAANNRVCGTAFYNTLDTSYAQWSVVFLDATPGCGARDFGTPTTGAGKSEAIALQELLHNENMVRPQAPHHCAAAQGHICTAQAGARVLGAGDPESGDVLFPFVTVPLRDKALDNGHDDYYDHPFPYRDLSESPFLEG
jgi:hypothetical protein